MKRPFAGVCALKFSVTTISCSSKSPTRPCVFGQCVWPNSSTHENWNLRPSQVCGGFAMRSPRARTVIFTPWPR